MIILRILFLSSIFLLSFPVLRPAMSSGIMSLQMMEKRSTEAILEFYNSNVVDSKIQCNAVRISHKGSAAFLIECSSGMSKETNSVWLSKSVDGALVSITPVFSESETEILNSLEEKKFLDGLVVLKPCFLSDAEKRELLSQTKLGFRE
ncbi:hypothetical protein FDK21_03565 [Cohaesibacter sp. CAU 1516]|uniref:hypothetical protein n=1 Tax=Cohaesibacter sp. CAU 1516 TaxID=2576038 RepID=UPI0010FDDB4A|nr:hypothetical protein [Cohaesibacter sp. CAU 1516]TLP48749.1 hypothetical protein FDK21_03565 [Cohaesibacter sp. CAU 1516]